MAATRTIITSDKPRMTRFRWPPNIDDRGRIGVVSFSSSLRDKENSYMPPFLVVSGECTGGGICSLGCRRSRYDNDLCGPDTTSGASIAWAGGRRRRCPPTSCVRVVRYVGPAGAMAVHASQGREKSYDDGHGGSFRKCGKRRQSDRVTA